MNEDQVKLQTAKPFIFYYCSKCTKSLLGCNLFLICHHQNSQLQCLQHFGAFNELHVEKLHKMHSQLTTCTCSLVSVKQEQVRVFCYSNKKLTGLQQSNFSIFGRHQTEFARCQLYSLCKAFFSSWPKRQIAAGEIQTLVRYLVSRRTSVTRKDDTKFTKQ